MKHLDRNIGILEHIVGYCGQIEETIRRFGNSDGGYSKAESVLLPYYQCQM